MLGMLLMPLRARISRVVGEHRRDSSFWLIVIASILMTGLTACGSQSSVPVAHQPTTHTLTVTATSGVLSHSTILNLTVQ